MEKSLYFDFTKKFFPQLVTSIVEKLNEKRQSSLPYLYKSLLTPTFSADGRWASILAEYNRVAADVVALDSELPLKSRDSITTANGDIPKMGLKLYLTEKQMKDIDAMIAQGQNFATIANKIFDDVPRVIEGIYERIEDIFLSELSTGVGLSSHNVGTGIRIDVGYDTKNKFGVTKVWSDATAAPLDDIQKIFDKALDDQNTITDIYADDAWLNAFYKHPQVRGQFAFNAGISTTSGSNVPVLDFEKAGQVLLSKWGINLHRVARKVKTEVNGKKSNHSPWAVGTAVFVCDEVLGDLVWTTCAESTRRVANVEYQEADEFILVSKYSLVDPLREFTASQAMVVPIINNVDRIYVLDSTQVVG